MFGHNTGHEKKNSITKSGKKVSAKKRGSGETFGKIGRNIEQKGGGGTGLTR